MRHWTGLPIHHDTASLLLPIYTNQAHICPQQGTLSCVSSPLGSLPRNPFGIRKTPLGADPAGWLSGSHLCLAAGVGSGPRAHTVGPRAAGFLRDGTSPLLAQPAVAMAMAGYCFLTASWLAQSQPAPALLSTGMCSAYQALLPFLCPQLGALSRACRKNQRELELPASFPRLENPRSFSACFSSQCSRTDPSCLLFPPCFSVAKFSLCCFFHPLPVTYHRGDVP